MVYISACITEDADKAHRVYKQTKDNLPEHVKDSVFWIETDAATGYYNKYTSGLEPVEFVNDHWYRLVQSKSSFLSR